MRPPERKSSSNGRPKRVPGARVIEAASAPVARMTPAASAPVARMTPAASAPAARMTPTGRAVEEGSLALEGGSPDTELQDLFFKSGLSHDVLLAESERARDEDVLNFGQ